MLMLLERREETELRLELEWVAGSDWSEHRRLKLIRELERWTRALDRGMREGVAR